MSAEDLKEEALQFGLKGDHYASVGKAYEAARLYSTKKRFDFYWRKCIRSCGGSLNP